MSPGSHQQTFNPKKNLVVKFKSEGMKYGNILPHSAVTSASNKTYLRSWKSPQFRSKASQARFGRLFLSMLVDLPSLLLITDGFFTSDDSDDVPRQRVHWLVYVRQSSPHVLLFSSPWLPCYSLLMSRSNIAGDVASGQELVPFTPLHPHAVLQPC